VAGEGFAQGRPAGAELRCGGVGAAQLLGQRVGPFSFGPVGEEAAGLPAQRVMIVPTSLLRSALGYEQVHSELDVELYAAAAGMRLRPAAWP
jgi:hypothetical protein